MSETTPSLIGERYLIGGELGRGGMAVVHRAWDCVLNRDVAVKMLSGLTMDSTARDRFQHEGELLARLSHPGLIILFDAGTHDDRPYLVMELITGGTLTDSIRAHRPTLDEVAAIGAALADTLAYVHECGIVHRDVKPSNVLIGTDRRVWLADFGIAKLLDSAVRHTATGLTVGTAAYLSPEQIRGHPAGSASDIYALGLVLLETVSGHPAFPGTPDVAALARLTEAPAIGNALPEPLRSLLGAMTADQADRRPTAAEVATRLRAMGPSLSLTEPTEARASGSVGIWPGGEDAVVTAEGLTATGETTRPASAGEPARNHRWTIAGGITLAAASGLVLVLTAPLSGPDQPGSAARPAPTGPTSTESAPSALSTNGPGPAVTGVPTGDRRTTSTTNPTQLTAAPTTVPATSSPDATTKANGKGKAKGKAQAPGQLKKGDG